MISEPKLTPESAQKIMASPGETRGITIKTDWEYVLNRWDQAGLHRLEARLAELGFPLKYDEIRPMDFYPVGLDALSIAAIQEVFELTPAQLQEMGESAVKFSIFLKIFMKYFPAINLLTKEAPAMWRKHYTIGDLEISELSEEKRYAVLRLGNFAVHPAHCPSFAGYFSKILSMAVKAKVSCEERKCVFRGDDFHEYLLKW